MKIRSTFFLVTYLALCFCAPGQDDYHFFLGEEELSGVDIYGITEDGSRTYWITTNKGLYSYDGYEFRHYSHPDQMSASLFNPTIDYAGNLYCSNLSGQIFKMVDDQMELVHTVPDSLVSAYLGFEFLPNNELIVTSKQCYRVKESGIQKIVDIESHASVSANLARRPDRTLVLNHMDDSSTLINESDHTIIKSPVLSRGNLSYYINKDRLLINDSDQKLIIADTISGAIRTQVLYEAENQARFYPVSSHFWVAGNTSGVKKMNYTEADSPGEVMFSNYFISYVLEDSEKNILLGTFDNGIIVMPNSSMEIIRLPENIKLSKIVGNGKEGLFLGSANGELYEWTEGGLYIFSAGTSKRIEVLEYFPQTKQLLADQNSIAVFDSLGSQITQAFMGSIKDVVHLKERQYAIGSHSTTSIIKVDEEIRIQSQHNTGRTSAIMFNPETDEIVVATTQGLVAIDPRGKMTEYHFNEGNFLVNDLSYHQGVILVATQKYGILKTNRDSLVELLSMENGLVSDNINQIESLGDTLYLSTEEGFQVVGPDLKSLAVLSKSDGLAGKKIHDFVVGKAYIWFLNQSGLQRLNKSFFSRHNDRELGIKEVITVINGEKSTGKIEVPPEQGVIEFRIIAPSLSRMDDITYAFRLSDGPWSQNAYTQNAITYRALTFGDYTFQVQLRYKGVVVDERKIDFHVDAPYYLKWWFISGIAMIFLISTYAFYRHRLKVQAIRHHQLAELNTSKLAALQSQMNPHFIFNALNSIQEYIMSNERKLAGKYLGKFADLMRIYLD